MSDASRTILASGLIWGLYGDDVELLFDFGVESTGGSFRDLNLLSSFRFKVDLGWSKLTIPKDRLGPGGHLALFVEHRPECCQSHCLKIHFCSGRAIFSMTSVHVQRPVQVKYEACLDRVGVFVLRKLVSLRKTFDSLQYHSLKLQTSSAASIEALRRRRAAGDSPSSHLSLFGCH
jgi:hypothetical protein